MKLLKVNIIIAVAFVASLLLFNYKVNNSQNDIDRLAGPLKAMQKCILPNSTISFSAPSASVELLIWSRYILFPVQIDRLEEIRHDTMLCVYRAGISDSVKNALLENKTIILIDSNSEYRCYLLADAKD